MRLAFRYAVGDVVEVGSRLGTVVELVERDKRWKVSGCRVVWAQTGFDSCAGMSEFVADYLSHTRLAPLDWAPVPGGGIEERWVETSGVWHREVRPT